MPKRQGTNRQLRPEEVEALEENGEEAKAGTFAKADAETLKKRRIVKVKRKTSKDGEAEKKKKMENPFASLIDIPETKTAAPEVKKIEKKSPEEKLHEFYAKFNPEKLHSVPDLVKKYEGRMDILFDKLDSKYGIHPDDMDNPVAMAAALQNKKDTAVNNASSAAGKGGISFSFGADDNDAQGLKLGASDAPQSNTSSNPGLSLSLTASESKTATTSIPAMTFGTDAPASSVDTKEEAPLKSA
eukprot:g329.t1